MSVATFLHLYHAGESTVRAVALTTDVVRIGRGPLCEIRLTGEDLAAVQMVLRRRGHHWSIQPIGSSGRVRLDGEILRETARFLPGAFAQTGDYRFTLVEVDPVAIEEVPGSFARPIVLGTVRAGVASDVEPAPTHNEAHDPAPVEAEPAEPIAEPLHAAESPPSPDPVTRWREVVDRTGEWLEARRRDTPRTGEWSAPRPTEPDRFSRELRERRGRQSSLESRAYPRWSAPASKPVPPGVESPGSTGRFPDVSRSTPPESFDSPPPRSHPRQATSEPVFDSGSDDWLDSEERAARMAWESETTVDVGSAPADFDLPDDFEQISTIIADEPLYVESTEPPAELSCDDAHSVQVEPIDPTVQATDPTVGATDWRFATSPDPTETGVQADEEPSLSAGPLTRAADDDDSAEDREVEEHWPSVATILPAHFRAVEAASKKSLRRAPLHGPTPTLSQPPRTLAIPLWISIPPFFAVSLIVGLVTLYLTASWANDSRAAGSMVSRWVAGDVEENLGRFDPVPEPAWWASTSRNLYLHAATLGSAPRDGLDREDSRTLLDLAEVSAPWHPGVRYAREIEAGKTTGTASEQVLPASHDIATLGLAACRMVSSGSRTDAAALMRSALEMALTLDPEAEEYPPLDRDGSGLRLMLPEEAVVGSMLAAYRASLGDSEPDWNSLIPHHAGLWLAVYRLERNATRTRGRAILDRIVAMPDEPTAGGHVAWHRAAKAEALALIERWDAAEQAYSLALDAQPGAVLASVIWFNLSDVQTRRGESDAARLSRRTARRLAASLSGRLSEQARGLHERLDNEGAAR